MDIQKKKDYCNKKYAEAIIYAKREDVKKCRECLFEVMDAFLEMTKSVSKEEQNVLINKTKLLLELAKTIAIDGFTDDVMFSLTGSTPQTKKESLQVGNLANEELPEEGLDNEVDIDNIEAEICKQEEKINSQHKENNAEIFEKNDDEFQSSKNQLRPLRLSDYFGQNKIKKILEEALIASKTKNDCLDHVLLFGSAGLGKTTLAQIISNEMNSNCIFMNGPAIKDIESIAKVFKNIKKGDIVFIDEIHRINVAVAEILYTIMEDYILSYIDSKGNNIKIKVPKFTLIGATTHSGLLEKPMRDRFPLQFKLENYSNEELVELGKKSFSNLGYMINDEVMLNIAKRSRGIPRICNGFIKRISDKALVRNLKVITNDIVEEFFKDNEINEIGLTNSDINLLKVLVEKYNGGPVGLDTLALSLGEGKNIIENQYEPYLIYLGFIQVTNKGRMATDLGVNYLKGI